MRETVTIDVGRGPELVDLIDYHLLHIAVRRKQGSVFWVPLNRIVS